MFFKHRFESVTREDIDLDGGTVIVVLESTLALVIPSQRLYEFAEREPLIVRLDCTPEDLPPSSS